MDADSLWDATTGTARRRAEGSEAGSAPRKGNRLVGTPDITVILPVRNEGAHIEAILADLQAQELDGLELEVLVVDGQSDDDTVARVQALATEDPRIRVLDNPRRLSSAARAIGADAARGRFIAFVDGHCRLPGTTLLSDMVALFEKTNADCLARPQPLLPQATGLVARAIAAGRTSSFGHSLRSTIYDEAERAVDPTSAGAMYRREVFERVGNFDPAFDACEDVEFNWRVAQAGLSAWTSPKMAVRYEPRRSLRALSRQMTRYGLGRARLHRKHRSAFSVESVIPAGFTAGLPLLLAVPLVPAPWHWALLGPYLLYAALSLGAAAVTAARHGLTLFPLLPVVFFVIHTGLGWGYLRGWLSKRPPFAPETTT